MCCMDLELISGAEMAIFREIDLEGKWVSVVSQLVMVSGCLHHLVAELVPQHHILTFFSDFFVRFLDYNN